MVLETPAGNVDTSGLDCSYLTNSTGTGRGDRSHSHSRTRKSRRILVSEDTACDVASSKLFRRLDRYGIGQIEERQVLPLWPELSRHMEGTNASGLAARISQRSTPITRDEWMSLMNAIRSIVGPRLFRSSLRAAQEHLEHQPRSPSPKASRQGSPQTRQKANGGTEQQEDFILPGSVRATSPQTPQLKVQRWTAPSVEPTSPLAGLRGNSTFNAACASPTAALHELFSRIPPGEVQPKEPLQVGILESKPVQNETVKAPTLEMPSEKPRQREEIEQPEQQVKSAPPSEQPLELPSSAGEIKELSLPIVTEEVEQTKDMQQSGTEPSPVGSGRKMSNLSPRVALKSPKAQSARSRSPSNISDEDSDDSTELQYYAGKLVAVPKDKRKKEHDRELKEKWNEPLSPKTLRSEGSIPDLHPGTNVFAQSPQGMRISLIVPGTGSFGLSNSAPVETEKDDSEEHRQSASKAAQLEEARLASQRAQEEHERLEAEAETQANLSKKAAELAEAEQKHAEEARRAVQAAEAAEKARQAAKEKNAEEARVAAELEEAKRKQEAEEAEIARRAAEIKRLEKEAKTDSRKTAELVEAKRRQELEKSEVARRAEEIAKLEREADEARKAAELAEALESQQIEEAERIRKAALEAPPLPGITPPDEKNYNEDELHKSAPPLPGSTPPDDKNNDEDKLQKAAPPLPGSTPAVEKSNAEDELHKAAPPLPGSTPTEEKNNDEDELHKAAPPIPGSSSFGEHLSDGIDEEVDKSKKVADQPPNAKGWKEPKDTEEDALQSSGKSLPSESPPSLVSERLQPVPEAAPSGNSSLSSKLVKDRRSNTTQPKPPPKRSSSTPHVGPEDAASKTTKMTTGLTKPYVPGDKRFMPPKQKDEKKDEGVKLPPLQNSRSAPGTLQTVDTVDNDALVAKLQQDHDALVTKLQDELTLERVERERMSERVKDLERKLRNAANKPRLGITKNTPYKAAPLPPPPPASPKNHRGLLLPALRTIPHSPSPQRWLDEQGVAASAQADMENSRSPEASRADRSKSRTEAIKKLESKGLNNWKERRAEKVARLQDLTVFRDSMWGSFFEWHEDYHLA